MVKRVSIYNINLLYNIKKCVHKTNHYGHKTGQWSYVLAFTILFSVCKNKSIWMQKWSNIWHLQQYFSYSIKKGLQKEINIDTKMVKRVSI